MAGVFGARMLSMLLHPEQEWPRIAADGPQSLRRVAFYAAGLSVVAVVLEQAAAFAILAIAPGASVIPGFARVPLATTLSFVALAPPAHALVMAGLALRLAPRYAGTVDNVRALQFGMYATTPVAFATVFLPIPMLGIVIWVIASAYWLRLFEPGAHVLLRVPEERIMDFTVAFVLAMGLIALPGMALMLYTNQIIEALTPK